MTPTLSGSFGQGISNINVSNLGSIGNSLQFGTSIPQVLTPQPAIPNFSLNSAAMPTILPSFPATGAHDANTITAAAAAAAAAATIGGNVVYPQQQQQQQQQQPQQGTNQMQQQKSNQKQ